MKSAFLLAALAAASTGLRIMSYNIRAGDGMSGVFNLTWQASIINQYQPDVLGLQEVDQYTKRHYINEPEYLANLTHMHYVFGKMRDFQGGGYGVSVLTREAPLETRTIYYHPPGQPRSVCDDGPSSADYCQGAVAVRVHDSAAGRDVWFLTTHIGLFNMQLDEVKELVSEGVAELVKEDPNIPVFITGDFNSVPSDEAIKYMVSEEGGFVDTWEVAGVGDGFTFNSQSPFERIDYVFQKKPTLYSCSKIVVPESLASDHFPIVAEFN